MNYKSCRYVNEALCFNDTKISYCTVGNQSKNKQYAILQENYNGEQIDWENLLDRIEADKESHRQGKIIDSCKDCLLLNTVGWDYDNKPRKFKYVLFSNWYACNSACRYCWRDDKDFLLENIDELSEINPNDTYDIIPIVKDLIEKNLLSEEVTIDFAGGEPTMYYKFDEALKMFIDAGVKNIVINTNAINYSKEIERAVALGVANVVVSVDAGSKEVHQKIKRVVSYDRVLKNLEKYSLSKNPKNKNEVCSKFIVIYGYNDKEEEILNWIKTAKKMNISKLFFNADDRMFMTEHKIEEFQKVKEMVDYFMKAAQKEKMHYMLFSNALNVYSTLGLKQPNNVW